MCTSLKRTNCLISAKISHFKKWLFHIKETLCITWAFIHSHHCHSHLIKRVLKHLTVMLLWLFCTKFCKSNNNLLYVTCWMGWSVLIHPSKPHGVYFLSVWYLLTSMQILLTKLPWIGTRPSLYAVKYSQQTCVRVTDTCWWLRIWCTCCKMRGWCIQKINGLYKRDVTPVHKHWSYISFAQT